jgi:hypothetical protein
VPKITQPGHLHVNLSAATVCESHRAGKLIQRSWQDNDGNKRQTVEIQVTHVEPDLQFATAEVAKSTAERSRTEAVGLAGYL